VKFINSKEEHPLNKLESEITLEESKFVKSIEYTNFIFVSISPDKKYSKLVGL
jgi:hypothetical protein